MDFEHLAMYPTEITRLKTQLAEVSDLDLVVLVGSRAVGSVGDDSDWDIAVRWDRHLTLFDRLGRTETLRRALARELGVPESRVDVIDLASAGLAMRAVAAEEGVVLKGEDTLAWSHFLLRAWRDLEDYYWEQSHAA